MFSSVLGVISSGVAALRQSHDFFASAFPVLATLSIKGLEALNQENIVDDLEMEEWMELTDDQQEAVIDREMRAYCARLDRMTVRQQVSHHRRAALRGCLTWRRMRSKGWIAELATQYLRARQMRLLKLRIWRATGVYPGEA